MCMYILVVSLSDANEESYIRSAALLCVVYSRRQGAQPLKSPVALAAHRGAAVRNTVAFNSLFVDLDSQSGSGWDFDNPILIRRERQRNYQNERDRERGRGRGRIFSRLLPSPPTVAGFSQELREGTMPPLARFRVS